ncbi:MAG: hypothetical protein N4A57_16265 [Anaeromicrobium sp.]|uniref:hypothetical protein n=1 Tax=Anaeromicrobium sp. TaxID=1929132 RepID=UPI0025F605D3|nr:hypothetical protein [Anaeromicrobium sp.]MCT4595802.1 hypothetical protein [Anaeromicrobium sp.]
MSEKLLLQEILKELGKINTNLIEIRNNTSIKRDEKEDLLKIQEKTNNKGEYSWESLMPHTDKLNSYTKNKK